MLIRIALRNLLLHRKRSFTVGSLLMLGAWLLVVGQAALDAVQGGLERSVVDSLSGHVQLYSATAPDKLELYQSAVLAQPDLGQLDDFSVLKAAALADPNVEAIVPMGLSRSMVTGSSVLENKVRELRAVVNANTLAEAGPLITHLRRLIRGLAGQLVELRRVAADAPESVRQTTDLERANGDEFWRDFGTNSLASLEFLENRIVPLGLQSSIYFIGFVGTDIQAFAKHFSLFEMMDGEMVPPGERGFIFSTTWYERFAKNRTARRLDQIKEAMEVEGRQIEGDEDLTRSIDRNVHQVSQITDQLDDVASAAMRVDLLAELGHDVASELTLDEAMAEFFRMDDANFESRYKYFYDAIVPRIRLYAFSVGDKLTLLSQTRSGYPRAVNVKVWGVYRLKGLEKSMLAGAYNIMDLVTFRDLLGLSGGVDKADVDAIKARAGIETVNADSASAEDALFGGDTEVVAEVENQVFDDLLGNELAGLRRKAEEASSRPFTQAELEEGPIVNAAVFLKNREDLVGAAAALTASLHAKGVEVQALTWEEARGDAVSGVSIGITVIFYGVVFIVFLVALGVIINSLLMSTTERTREIGTMRAIGATRGFVVRMFTIEALVTSMIFGGFGVALGALTVVIIGESGLAATSEIQYFIFGGAKLYPTLDLSHVLNALIVVGAVATVACFIPALIASRIAPVTAMQARD